MSSPPTCTNVKPPIDDFLTTVLHSRLTKSQFSSKSIKKNVTAM